MENRADLRGPNKKRIRPSVCYTLPANQVQYLGDLADRSGRPRSKVLEDIISFFHGMHIDRVADGNLFRRVAGDPQEGEVM